MTTEQIAQFWLDIDAKQAVIESTLKQKVFPIVLQSVESENEFVVGWAKKPDMITQLRLIDKSEGSANGILLEVAHTVLTALILTSETDSRITDENGEFYAVYWKGACYSLKQFMGLAIPTLKKK